MPSLRVYKPCCFEKILAVVEVPLVLLGLRPACHLATHSSKSQQTIASTLDELEALLVKSLLTIEHTAHSS